MSIDAMGAVWGHSEHKGSELLVMLAMADNADELGFCFPSYPHLAAKTRLSERQVRRIVTALCDTDELSLTSRGRPGRANEYTVNIAALRAKAVSTAKGGGQDVPSPESGTGHFGPDPGHVMATSTVSTNHQEKQPVAAATDSTLFPVEIASSTGADSRATETRAIWEHYVATFDPPRKELTASREKLIHRVLKECEAMEDRVEYLKSAITGLKVWREQRPGDTALSAVFQTRPNGSALGDQLQFFVDQATSGGTSARPKVPSVLSGTISARKREVVDMLAYPDSPDHKQRGLAAVDWLKQEAHEEPIIENGALRGWRRLA